MTNKVALLHSLEKDATPLTPPPRNHDVIIDGMAVEHKCKPTGKTFKQMALHMLELILCTTINNRNRFFFFVYRELSITKAERMRRSSAKLNFSRIVSSQLIRQWNNFLSSSQNKTALIQFLCHNWKLEKYHHLLRRKQVYIAYEEISYWFNGDEWCEVQESRSNEEGADTRMLLHANRTRSNGIENILIHTPDTDVFIIMMFFLNSIHNLYIKTGTKGKLRIIDLESVKEACKNSFQNTDVDKVFNAIPGLHASIGCDTVSTFAGKEKVKAFKLGTKNNELLQFFQVIRNEWALPEEVYSQAERFICHFYGHREENDVNLLRYCARSGKIEEEELPPHLSSLRKHVDRVNYQSRI